jgi:hypothetical protein
MLQICVPQRSRALKILTELAQARSGDCNARRETWPLLLLHLGDMADWPGQQLRTAFSSALLVEGNIWRRFIFRFLDQWPWKLCLLLTGEASEATQLAIATEFIGANDDCLDAFFSRKLRRKYKTIEDFSSHFPRLPPPGRVDWGCLSDTLGSFWALFADTLKTSCKGGMTLQVLYV